MYIKGFAGRVLHKVHSGRWHFSHPSPHTCAKRPNCCSFNSWEKAMATMLPPHGMHVSWALRREQAKAKPANGAGQNWQVQKVVVFGY